jgi:6-phosphogluconolactonase
MENLTRRTVLATALTAAPSLILEKYASAQSNESLVFIGVYTDQGSKSRGVYSYRWNTEKGELTPLGLAAATPNPSFLAMSKRRRTLYAVNEISDYKGAKDGSVSSFTIDEQSGRLSAKNVVSSGGAGPCNINLDHQGESLFVANYDGGSAASYLLPAAGLSAAPVNNPHYSGHGPDAQRQTSSHAHCATVSPDNQWLLVNDLGLDRIHIYRLKTATAQLVENKPPAYEALPKSGPRSFAFHPNGRFAYSTNELSNTIDVLGWDTKAGVLTRLQNISTLPAGFAGANNTLASVNVDRAGKFVYTSNRGDENSIAVFAIDAATGKLTHVQSIDSGGKIPRHFAIDPSGNWIVVAHQGSHTLVVFARDAATGKLTPTGRSYPIDWPTCVLFG